MTAAELERSGLISDVFPFDTFHKEVMKRAELLASEYLNAFFDELGYPPNALKQTKALTRLPSKEALLEGVP